MERGDAVVVKKVEDSGLTTKEIRQFRLDGFVAVRGAFPRALADEACSLLWRKVEARPDDSETWSEPVIRLPASTAPTFAKVANTTRLRHCYDQLVGEGRWQPPAGLGAFRIRFPSPTVPRDAVWHCDGAFGDWPYRLNIRSRGRALLMLYLLTDVGQDDAPTRLRLGSHLIVSSLLAPAGDEGVPFHDLSGRLRKAEACPVVQATGQAGDVYLCHPFLVHAAEVHRGAVPCLTAKPGLAPVADLEIDRPDGSYSPVERAIRLGLGYD